MVTLFIVYYINGYFRFWNIRTFYHEALHISSRDLPNVCWSDVVKQLKDAQKDHKMNIQKQELTELDIYHRILRFKNYMVAMVNKSVIQCRFWVPLYGEKVFFTQGLKFNYELILFCKCTTPVRVLENVFVGVHACVYVHVCECVL